MSMTLDEYDEWVTDVAVYEQSFYPFASLMVEAAEFSDLVVKPWLRGDKVNEMDLLPKALSEAGDVLWNLSAACGELGISLQEVLDYNVNKINSRRERGVLKGSGGDR